MAKFRCIKVHDHATVTRRKQVRTSGDIVQVVEYQEDITFSPGAYGHENIKVGGEYKIDDERLAAKARANTEYFEEVFPAVVGVETSQEDNTQEAETPAKKRGRPPKEKVDVSDSGGDTQQSAQKTG